MIVEQTRMKYVAVRKIPKAAAMKVPNVITFFGNRKGMSDAEATANCIEGLNRVKKIGEDHGVTALGPDDLRLLVVMAPHPKPPALRS